MRGILGSVPSLPRTEPLNERLEWHRRNLYAEISEIEGEDRENILAFLESNSSIPWVEELIYSIPWPGRGDYYWRVLDAIK